MSNRTNDLLFFDIPVILFTTELHNLMTHTLRKSGAILLPFIIFWLLPSLYSHAQIIIQKFPKHNQVFQRDEKDEAVLTINADVLPAQRGVVTLIIKQDDQPYLERSIVLAGETKISFTPKIKAGLYNYSVALHLDTKEIIKAERVAAGDVFLVYGQSNALGYSEINTYRPSNSVYIRYFIMNNYENLAGQWLVPSEEPRWAGIGLFPLELQRILFEKYQYPIGVIVGAVGGANLAQLSNRNSAKPADISTDYGKLLSQVISSGQKDKMKYLIFRQGETDATDYVSSLAYAEGFKKLIDYFKTDFPALEKIYNFQINILNFPNTKAGIVREFQRNSDLVSPLIRNISTVGTVGYDGLHYNTRGYTQGANELARVMGKEIYGIESPDEIYSPNLKLAYWSNKKLVLEFDEKMQMKYPADTMIDGKLWSMKDYIFIDSKSGVVNSGYAEGNKIFIDVSLHGKNVSYLPKYYGKPASTSDFYKGPHFTNSLGMRAFSFDSVGIQEKRIVVDNKIGPLSLRSESAVQCTGVNALIHFTNKVQDIHVKYLVQLSDENGQFIFDNIIGEGDSSPITITIPENFLVSDAYKIRLITDNKTNNLTINNLTIAHKATVKVSTKTPEILTGQDAIINLKFTGSRPFDILLSDSSRYSTNNLEFDLIKKPLATANYTVAEMKNICGAGTAEGTATIKVNLILVNEPLNPNIISVFPNPVTDYFVIKINSTAKSEFNLFDVNGRLISECSFYEEHQISTDKLDKGIYFYRIKNGKSINSGKIIIE